MQSDVLSCLSKIRQEPDRKGGLFIGPLDQ